MLMTRFFPMRFWLLIFALLCSAQAERIPSFALQGHIKEGKELQLRPAELEGPWVKSYSLFEPYLKSDVTYRGISMKEFVERFGKPQTQKLVITAMDGYVITFEKQEWEKELILLAIQKDGAYMGYKDFGPIKVVYPHYDKRYLESKSHFIKWIWMIKTIQFLP